jgi:hypothetical protein
MPLPMPTNPSPTDQTARLLAARDDSMRRYAEHLSAVHLKNSRWSAMLSRRRLTSRGYLMSTAAQAGLPAHAR